MKFKSSSSAFTLVELLVVIGIIAVLSSIVTVSLGTAKQKSRDGKRIGDIKTIQVALATYYANNGFYPKNIYAPSGSTVDPANGLAPAYIAIVPKDPNANTTDNCTAATANTTVSCYHYSAYQAPGGNGTCTAANPPVVYHLGAGLEDTGNPNLTQDVDANATLNPIPYGATYVSCGTAPSPFNGTAVTGAIKCSGVDTAAVTPDSCYDLTP